MNAPLYSVWRNLPGNDECIVIDQPARKCIEIMGISMERFHHLRSSKAPKKHYTIIKTQDEDWNDNE